MSKGVNKFIGIGNCTKDPELRYLPSGGAVANVTIACGDSYKDKNTGQIVDATEFVRVVFYGKPAEIIGEYCKKGSPLYVEGSLHTRKWQDKQTGQDKYSTEIKALNFQLLGGKGERQESAPAHPSSGYAAPADDFSDPIPF